MQNEVVDAIHQLAAASKLTGDITFTTLVSFCSCLCLGVYPCA